MDTNKVTMERNIQTGKRDINKKRFVLLLLSLFCFIPMAFSQSANALYLKDGSRIIGHIMELDSVGDVRILTTEGEMLSFSSTNIEEINWSYVMKDPGPGAIYRYGDTFRWKYNNTELSDKNYEKYFDDDLYHTYVGGSNQFNIGGACWLYGITCLVMTVVEFDPKADKQSGSFFAYAGGANALICLGCVFTGIGKRRLDWVERTFNIQNAADNELSYSSRIRNSLKLNPSVLMTAQRDLGVGATLSFTF